MMVRGLLLAAIGFVWSTVGSLQAEDCTVGQAESCLNYRVQIWNVPAIDVEGFKNAKNEGVAERDQAFVPKPVDQSAPGGIGVMTSDTYRDMLAQIDKLGAKLIVTTPEVTAPAGRLLTINWREEPKSGLTVLDSTIDVEEYRAQLLADSLLITGQISEDRTTKMKLIALVEELPTDGNVLVAGKRMIETQIDLGANQSFALSVVSRSALTETDVTGKKPASMLIVIDVFPTGSKVGDK